MLAPAFEVLEEAIPAARQRTDLLIQKGNQRACIELKILGNGTLEENLAQLREYLKSLPGYHGFLLRLDRSETPKSGQDLYQYKDGEITIWDLHVNRQPASQKGKT